VRKEESISKQLSLVKAKNKAEKRAKY
jgi:hypothetical protein